MKLQEFLTVLLICGTVSEGVRIYENTSNDTVTTTEPAQTTTTTTTQTPNRSLDPVQNHLSENISKESEQSVSNREIKPSTNNKKRESEEDNQNEASKKFTPSQQYNFEYEQLKKSLPFNDFRPANPYYKPMKFDASYYSNSPWNDNKPSEPNKVKTDYPKYTQDSQQQQTYGIPQQTTQNFNENPESWLTNSEIKFKEETPEKLSGKWQWVPNEKPEIEQKVLSNTPFSFPESINEKHPYSFDQGESPFNIPTTTTLLESQFPDVEDKDKGHKEIIRSRGVSPWSKILKLLTAVIPIGLLLSALTPRVIYVNPNMTQPATFTSPGVYPSRQRSLDYSTEGEDDRGRKLSNPLMDFLNVLGNEQLEERGNSCENRYFCEMARLGSRKKSDVLYKMLWKISIETPYDKAERNGLGEVFQAIKEDNCVIFDCETVIK